MEMYPMGHQKQIQDSSQERINNYLSRFKTTDIALPSSDSASENALDQYLLARAAEELRAGQAQMNKLNRKVVKR
jgi:hypothetical protein